MDDKKLKKLEVNKKLRKIGLLPSYIDGSNDENSIDITKIPFSKNYLTYKEYEEDLIKLLDISLDTLNIPDELYNKIKETKIELGLIES